MSVPARRRPENPDCQWQPAKRRRSRRQLLVDIAGGASGD